MSLLTSERVPVKVYKWDDVGAPLLNKTANCMANIFKSCLITGYGAKTGAGWTMPFENVGAGVKVLKPELGPDTDFYLRLSADTGAEMAAQVYLNMQDANNGDLKLQCATPFRYATGLSSGKWLLVASPRGFWFFCEQGLSGTFEKMGASFFNGALSSDVDSAVYLHHTGGTYIDGDYTGVLDEVNREDTDYVSGKLLMRGGVAEANMSAWGNGFEAITDADLSAPVLVFSNSLALQVTGCTVPLSGVLAANNYDTISIADHSNLINVIAHGSGSRANRRSSMLYIATDYWVY